MKLLAAAVAMLASPALALTPLPECVPSGAEAAAGVDDYSVQWHGNGFVLYPDWDRDTYRLFLDDCRGDRRLVMTARQPRSAEEAYQVQSELFDTVLAALEAKRSYTLGQIDALAIGQNARTKRGKAAYESCGCALYYGD